MILNDLNESKKLLKSLKSFLIIIRHAEKIVIPNDENQASILLTKKGIEDSKLFGKKIKKFFKNVSLVKSSPIKRCILTADSIIRSFSNSIQIKTSKNLGDPGIFVIDSKKASNNFLNYGVKGVIEKQLNEIPLPGMRDLKSGIKLLLEEIFQDLYKINGIGIYITHDAILIPLIQFLTKKFQFSENLIDFLNGILIWKEYDNTYVIWNGEKFIVNNKVNEIFSS